LSTKLVIADQIQFERNLADLAKLFEASFGKRISEAFLRWRYLMGPIENLHPAAWACSDTRIVANYSLGMASLRTGEGSLEKAGMSMSTMTHPNHRGQGLFPQLAKSLYSAIQHDGIDTVIGFPNDLSLRTFVDQLDWTLTSEISTLTLSLSGWIPRTGSPSAGLDWVTDRAPKRFVRPDWLEELIHVDRDAESLRWRYQDSPTNKYKFVFNPDASEVRSYAVFKWYGSSVDIVDLLPESSEDVTLLISAIANSVQGVASHLNVWMMPHLRFRTVLHRLGFAPSCSTSYFGVRTTGINRSRSRYRRPDQWFLQMGDSDVF